MTNILKLFLELDRVKWLAPDHTPLYLDQVTRLNSHNVIKTIGLDHALLNNVDLDMYMDVCVICTLYCTGNTTFRYQLVIYQLQTLFVKIEFCIVKISFQYNYSIFI